jgi:hypothetical protein
MEGFETIRQNADLIERGQAGATTDTGMIGTVAASYSGGKALARVTHLPAAPVTLFSDAAGQIGTGISMTFRARLTSNNSGPTTRRRNRYVNGNWVSPQGQNNFAGGTNANGIYRAVNNDILAVGGTPQVIFGNSGLIGTTDITFDANRSEYIAVVSQGGTSGGLGASFLTSTNIDSTTWTNTGTVTGINATNLLSLLYAPEISTTVCYDPGQSAVSRAYVRGPTGGFTLVSNTVAAIGSLIWTGARFLGTPVIATANTLVSSTDGATWTAPTFTATGSATSMTAQSVAFGGSTIVLGGTITSGTGNHIAYSTNNGSTFTTIAASSIGLTATNAPPLVAYGNGVFIALSPSGNTVAVSPDGIAWTTYSFSHTISSGAYSYFLSFEHDRFVFTISATGAQSTTGLYQGQIVATSTDGINWNFSESGFMITTTVNSTSGFLNPLLSATFFYGFALNSVSSVPTLNYRAGGTGGTTATAAPSPYNPYQRDTWNSYGINIIPTSPSTYTTQFTIDGTSLATLNQSYTLFSALASLPFTHVPTDKPGYYDPVSKMSIIPVIGSAVADVNFDGTGINWIPVTKPNTSSAALKVGNVWCTVGTTAFVDTSTDLQNWTTVSTGAAATTYNNGWVSNGVGMFVGSAGTLIRSTNGTSWTKISGPWSGSANLNGICHAGDTWVITVASATVFYYSKDDGLTWTAFTSQSVAPVSTLTLAQNSAFGAMWFGAGPGSLLKVTPVTGTGNAPTNAYVTYGTTQGGLLAFNGKYLLVGATSGGPLYSADGVTWTGTGANNRGSFLAVGTAFVGYGTTLNQLLIMYPEIGDVYLNAVLDTGDDSFSAYDDIVVTNFSSPNAGPQGDARIVLVPSDTDVQAQWTKQPSGAVTNAAAATGIPISTTQSYVESNAVGQQDIYGTSSFVPPSGLRPLAMSVEASFSRLFSNTPTVQVSLTTAAGSDNLPVVPIATPLGSNTYVSQVFNTQADNSNWNASAISGSELSITKVS